MAVPIRRQTPVSTPAHLRADHPAPASWLRSHAPNITLALLRLVAGLMFVQHGAQKIFGVLPMQGMPPWTGMPHVFTQTWFAGWIELLGGIFIALGLFTRLWAFIASGEMAVAYFQVHAPQGFFPVMNRGELAVLYCFVFLALAGLGAGAYSIDHMIAVARGKPKIVLGRARDQET